MAPLAAKGRMPTFATTSRQRVRGARRPRVSGFTLVELLVVLAIATLLIGVVPFAFGRLNEAAQYRNTVRTIMAQLSSARQLAVANGRPVAFRVDLAGRRFGLDGELGHDVPKGIELRATVAERELSEDRIAGIRFLPEGGATGGSIDVVRGNGDGTRISADWLFGRVSQSPLPR